MEIKTNEYHVWHSEQDGVLYFEGSFRLGNSDAYGEIFNLMVKALESSSSKLVIDLKSLQFLNSSGINLLAKFVITVRKTENGRLTIKGNNQIPWQTKSLANLKKLYPALILDLD
jgi:hypothetical protein